MARTRHIHKTQSHLFAFVGCEAESKKREKTWKIVKSFTFPRRSSPFISDFTYVFCLWSKWITRWRWIARTRAAKLGGVLRRERKEENSENSHRLPTCLPWTKVDQAVSSKNRTLKVAWKLKFREKFLVFASMKREGGKIVGIAIYNCNLWIYQSKHVVRTTT